MKKYTIGHLALGFVLAGPALAQPTWQQAVGPSAIADLSGTWYGGSSPAATALDAAGNTVVAGHFYGSLTLGTTTLVSEGYSDVFVARLSPSGQWLQAVRAGGPSEDFVSGLKLDAAGNAVIVGQFGNLVTGATATFGAFALASAGQTDAFVARLSPGGQWTQAVRAGGPGTDLASALALDSAGNAVVAGSFQGSLGLGLTALAADGVTTAAFVARLDLAAGTWTQASQTTCAFSTVPFRTQVSAVALDAAGNVVLAGVFDASARFGTLALTSGQASTAAYVARLSSSGQWTQAVPLSNNSRMAPPLTISALAVDGAGTATIAGVLVESAAFGTTTLTSEGGYDVFVARLSPAGVWTQAVRAGGAVNDLVNSLVVDAAGNATIAGVFGPYGPSNLPPTATFGTTTLSSAGGYDVFVAQLSAAGQWRYAVRAGGTGADGGSALAFDAMGNTIVAGNCSSPATFGATTLVGTSSHNMLFVARLGATAVTATQAATPTNVFTLSPNPASGLVHFNWTETNPAPCSLHLFDALGREVRRQQLPARTTATTLDVAGLVPGLYVVRCGTTASRLQVE